MSDVRKPKKQASITSFIYKDGPTRGSSTSTPDRSKRKDKEVQVTPSIEEQLCGDEANEDYWRELAIEREKALNDTLEENRSLCELIQGVVCIIQFTRFSLTLEISVRTAEKEEIEEVLDQITKENGLLKEKAERADVLAEVIQERVQLCYTSVEFCTVVQMKYTLLALVLTKKNDSFQELMPDE